MAESYSMTDTSAQPRTIDVGQVSDGPLCVGEPGDRVTLPAEAVLVGRAFVTGKSGSGKSNTSGVVIERLLDQGLALATVDVEGEYYGLKEEYEILHAGADDVCDIQVGPEHGEKLAQLGLERGVPFILDLSGYLDEAEADAMVRSLAEALFARAKQVREPFPVFLEECHEYIPEQGSAGETGEAVIRIAKRGRKHGLGLIGISQRPASVSKEFITQCNWLVWHRLTWDNDTAVVRRVLGSDYADAVGDLGDGEAFLGADWNDDVLRVQVDRKQTFDAGAAPGLDDVERPELKGVDADLVAELEEISDRAQQRRDEIERLEQRLDKREARIEALEAELADTKDIRGVMEDMVGSLAGEGLGGETTIEIDGAELQVPEVLRAEVMEIREDRREAVDRAERAEAERNHYRRAAEHLADLLAERGTPADYEALRSFVDEFAELTARHGEILPFDADAGDEDLAWLRNRAREAESQAASLASEVEDLENRLDRAQSTGGVDEDFADELAFLEHDAVRDQIEAAAASAGAGYETMLDLVLALVDSETPRTSEALATDADVHPGTARKYLPHLKRRQIVAVDESAEPQRYRLNVEGLEDIVAQARRSEQIAARRQRLLEEQEGNP